MTCTPACASLTAFGPRPLRSLGPWLLAASVLDHSQSSATLVIGVLRRSRSDRPPSARTPSSRPPLFGPLRLRHLGLLCSGLLRLGHPRIGPPRIGPPRIGPFTRSAPRALVLGRAGPPSLCSRRLVTLAAPVLVLLVCAALGCSSPGTLRSSVAPVLQCSISRPLCNSTIGVGTL